MVTTVSDSHMTSSLSFSLVAPLYPRPWASPLFTLTHLTRLLFPFIARRIPLWESAPLTFLFRSLRAPVSRLLIIPLPLVRRFPTFSLVERRYALLVLRSSHLSHFLSRRTKYACQISELDPGRVTDARSWLMYATSSNYFIVSIACVLASVVSQHIVFWPWTALIFPVSPAV